MTHESGGVLVRSYQSRVSMVLRVAAELCRRALVSCYTAPFSRACSSEMLRVDPDTEDVEMTTNDITGTIIGAAIAVHRELGPGLLESAYKACMCFELASLDVNFEPEAALKLRYRGQVLDCGYRMDLLVENRVIVELKSVVKLDPIHTAQMITYLRLAGCHVGLLINFNVKFLRDGVHRTVLGYQDERTLRRLPPTGV